MLAAKSRRYPSEACLSAVIVLAHPAVASNHKALAASNKSEPPATANLVLVYLQGSVFTFRPLGWTHPARVSL